VSFVTCYYIAELEARNESYDVIIGDLATPIDGGPYYKLYTKSFYELIIKPRQKQDGIHENTSSFGSTRPASSPSSSIENLSTLLPSVFLSLSLEMYFSLIPLLKYEAN